MNSPIKTNQLTYKFDQSLFSKNYDVFCIRTSDQFFKYGAYIIDAPLLSNNVCSVLFKSGNKLYVLMKSNDSNLSLLKDVTLKEDGGDRITISQVEVATLEMDIVLQLMLNSLGSYENPFLKFNNLTGHLYCFHPKWLRTPKNKPVINQVPCLELKISSELRLNMEVHTFTSERLRKNINFTTKKFEQYTKYVFSANNTLRRKLKDDQGDTFIMRQIRNNKTEIPFLDIMNLDHFNQSKMGILTTVLECFNDKFSGISHLEFTNIRDYQRRDYPRAVANESTKEISKLLKNRQIHIVDCIDDQYSQKFCKEIYDFLSSEYGITASCDKQISKGRLNIKAIHNADFYDGDNDPHQVFIDVAVQHITIEDFLGDAIDDKDDEDSKKKRHKKYKRKIPAVIHDLIIKDDLIKQKISLFDWSTLEFEEDIDFGIQLTKTKDDQNTKHAFMTIHPDGTFDISEQIYDPFEPNKYSQCIQIFEEAQNNSEKVRGLIRDTSNNINVIKDTGWFTIPEIDRIKAELSNGNTKLRGEKKREELLASCLDIKMFGDDAAEYCFAGTIGKGMQSSINCAANIRKIEPFEDSTLMFEKLLPIMSVTFVRNGQLTILPFPFKYLREYSKRLRQEDPVID